MPAAFLSSFSPPVARGRFEAAWPVLNRVIRYNLRHCPGPRRQEAIADALPADRSAWHGLVRRSLNPTRVN